MDVKGRLLKEQEVEEDAARVYVGDLPAGTYLLRVRTANGDMSKTFVRR